MNMTRDRVQSLAWALIISVSFALLLALTFKVNAVKSQVRLMDRRIVALKQEKTLLETEFQTRANQQQLAAFNDVDFGFKAPTAAQYVEGEQQLASLSKPAAPDAPAPILMASAEVPVDAKPAAGTLPAVFSTVAGNALATAPATRMLAQHGEKVAQVGRDKLEQKLALGDSRAPAPHKAALAQAAAEPRLSHASGTERIARTSADMPAATAKRDTAHGHAKLAPAAAPAAASADFLAAATGNDRLRAASATPARGTALAAAAKPAKHSATVADAFGADWMQQMGGSAKASAGQRGAPTAKKRRVALEDAGGTASQ